MNDETKVDAPTDPEMELDDLTERLGAQIDDEKNAADDADVSTHSAGELEAVFDVPVKVKAILGRTTIDVSELLKVGKGTVIELDRKVGEAIDIFVNNRLVARGEVVLVEDRLGITMTEMIKMSRD